MYENDKRIVLTLDAGGTNFVFSAIQGQGLVLEPVHLPAVTDDIDGCLKVLIEGFDRVLASLPARPVAISFAFPGPADYSGGVIGDLPNFPAFRGGVALGAFLEEHYGMPVFIENDGNLFAYGEALSGALPDINAMLREAGCQREYKNLLGITLGTGFGAGVVINGVLLNGDNGCGGDVWLMRNRKYPDLIAEESVSIRAVKRVYSELSGDKSSALTPYDIFMIAEGKRDGDQKSAIASFAELGAMAGAAIASALNIVDGIVVIGGGVSGAASYILPSLVAELRSEVHTFTGDSFPCVQMQVFNGGDKDELSQFLNIKSTEVQVPLSTKKVPYQRERATIVMMSQLGASRAIMLGAYAFALHSLDKRQ